MLSNNNSCLDALLNVTVQFCKCPLEELSTCKHFCTSFIIRLIHFRGWLIIMISDYNEMLNVALCYQAFESLWIGIFVKNKQI